MDEEKSSKDANETTVTDIDPGDRDGDNQPSSESPRPRHTGPRRGRPGYANARDVISPELLSDLQREYTGLLWVPRVRATNQRDEDVIKLKNKGLSAARIAELVSLTPRRVRQIVAQARKEGKLKEERWY